MIAASLKSQWGVVKNKDIEAHSAGKIQDDLKVVVGTISTLECLAE